MKTRNATSHVPGHFEYNKAYIKHYFIPFVNRQLFSNKMSKLSHYVFKQQETADMAFKFALANFMTRLDSIYLITSLNVPSILSTI